MYLKIRDSERVGGTHGRRRQRTDIDVVLDRPGLRALHADGLRPWNVAVDNGLSKKKTTFREHFFRPTSATVGSVTSEEFLTLLGVCGSSFLSV
jgi:hypothetical protein